MPSTRIERLAAAQFAMQEACSRAYETLKRANAECEANVANAKAAYRSIVEREEREAHLDLEGNKDEV